MEVNEAVRVEQRAASMRLVEMLAASDDQVIAYKAGLLAGLDPHSAAAKSLREQSALTRPPARNSRPASPDDVVAGRDRRPSATGAGSNARRAG